MTKALSIATLILCGALSSSASAQVAGGSTTVDYSLTEVSTQLALGWSAKRSILGRAVFNDSGDTVGKVQDLIVAPDKNVSYLIVGAGGFLGMGRHDVAIPITQIQERDGRLIMPGATKTMVKAMPRFDYSSDTFQREQLVANTERDLARGRDKLRDLQKRAAAATSEAKGMLEQQVATLQTDLKNTENKLDEMKRTNARRWREFAGDLHAATERLRM